MPEWIINPEWVALGPEADIHFVFSAKPEGDATKPDDGLPEEQDEDE